MKLHLARFLKLLITCAVIILVVLLLADSVAALALLPAKAKYSLICAALGILVGGAWIFTSD